MADITLEVLDERFHSLKQWEGEKFAAVTGQLGEIDRQLRDINGRQRKDHDVLTAHDGQLRTLSGGQEELRDELKHAMNIRLGIGAALTAIGSFLAGLAGVTK